MKIGVLGLGFMGSTHLGAYRRIPGVEIAAVASDIPERLTGDLSGVQGNIGGPGERWDFSDVAKYSDPFEALKNPNLDAVDICLPTNLHEPVAVAALKAGKHVLVEKPMALSAAGADAMVRAANESGRILMTAQVLRFFPQYSAARETICAGRFGPVRSAIFRRRCAAPFWSTWLGNKTASGGAVLDLLVHDLDFCLHAFGAPEAISAAGHEDLARGVDWVSANLYYPGIGGVVVTGGWHHPKSFPFSMEYTIVCDRGTLEFSSNGVEPTIYRDDGKADRLVLPERDGYQAEIEYFVDCCIKGRQPAFCPAAESAAAVKLALLVVEARERPGERLAFNL